MPPMTTISDWLTEAGFGQYADAFDNNAIDLDLLPELTDQDLRTLGVQALGHRKRLLKAIAAVRTERSNASGAKPKSYIPKHLAEKILLSRSGIEGERKQVTVLFADLKGSLEMLGDDPEAARRLLDPVLDLMLDAVHHYEGTVNQIMGDGIMALFGAPIAHEDHALRACYAAMRMQASVKKHSERMRQSEGVLLQVRIGLNSGEVVVRTISNDLHMDYSAVGQTTHVAARIEQLAPPGSILLSASTHRLVEGYIRAASLGPVCIRGMSEQQEIIEILGAGAARTRLQVAALRGLTRFIGRDTELTYLERALRDTTKGRGQVISIIGEAGVGKSRLIHEFTHSQTAKSCLILEAPSVSYGRTTSYLPVIGLLKSYFRISEHDAHREMQEKVTGKLLTLDATLSPHITPILALLDVPIDGGGWDLLDPPQRRQSTLNAVKRLLLRESQEQPLIVAFEDLHWIDRETEALLNGLIDALASTRILLLLSYRPEYQHRWGSKAVYSQLRLDSLPSPIATALVEDLLGPHASLKPLIEMLVPRGNPFFLEETVRSLVETGALSGLRGAYHLTRPVQDLEVPSTVQTILAARIDRLTPAQKRVLQAASVIGKDVPYALLAAVLGPTETLRHDLSDLQEAEFLFEVQIFPDLEYTFKHSLTHEVTYNSQLRDRRRQLHSQIFHSIRKVYSDRLAEHVERMALHALRGELWNEAAQYGWQSGLRALDRSAAAEAVHHLSGTKTALENLPSGPERTGRLVDLAFDMRNALFALGEFGRMGEVLDEARVQAESINDDRRTGWVSAYLAHRNSFLAEHELAIESARNAGRLAEITNDGALSVVSTYYLGQAFWFAGQPRLAEESLRRAMSLLKPEAIDERFGMTALAAVVVRWALAESLAEQGYFTEAIDVGHEGLSIAQHASHRPSEIYARYGLGYAFLRKGDYTAANRVLEPSLALCTELEIRVALPFVSSILACVYLRTNRGLDAESLLATSMEAADAMGINGLRSMTKAFLAELFLARGELSKAIEFASEATELARTRKEPGWEAWGLKVLADCHLFDGSDPTFAGSLYLHALSLAREHNLRPLCAQCHEALSRVTPDKTAASEHSIAAVALIRAMGKIPETAAVQLATSHTN